MNTKKTKNKISIILLFIVVLCVSSCTSQETGPIHILRIETLKEDVIGKAVPFIDVRTLEEYQAGHIDDAVHIPISDKTAFSTQIQQFRKEAPIYVYCHAGGRSRKASKLLEELGFQQIYDFSGGWKAWKKDQKIK